MTQSLACPRACEPTDLTTKRSFHNESLATPSTYLTVSFVIGTVQKNQISTNGFPGSIYFWCHNDIKQMEKLQKQCKPFKFEATVLIFYSIVCSRTLSTVLSLPRTLIRILPLNNAVLQLLWCCFTRDNSLELWILWWRSFWGSSILLRCACFGVMADRVFELLPDLMAQQKLISNKRICTDYKRFGFKLDFHN